MFDLRADLSCFFSVPEEPCDEVLHAKFACARAAEDGSCRCCLHAERSWTEEVEAMLRYRCINYYDGEIRCIDREEVLLTKNTTRVHIHQS